MILKVQIISLLFSFCYGIFFYLLLELNSKFLYSSHIIVRIVVSFLFVMFHTLLYFLILMRINYGYLHFYFFLCIILGYILCKVVYKKIVKKSWMCYNRFKISRWYCWRKKENIRLRPRGGCLLLLFSFAQLLLL